MAEEVLVGVPRDVERGKERGALIRMADREVRVDEQDPHAGGLTSLLEELAERRWPAYLKVDEDTGAITELRVPVIVRVGRLVSEPEGRFAVELVPSQARHELPADAPAGFRELLEESARSGTLLVVTEDDDHRILDVRRPEEDVALPRSLPVRGPAPTFRAWFFTALWSGEILAWLIWWLFPISRTKAKAAFDALNTLSCNPSTVPPPCIPFLYPDDGCWGRAHEMCRLMKGMSIPVRKVWIEGWLTAKTRNHPSCEVHWGWHVAPTVRVRRWWWFGASTQVIDPALFTGPVAQSTWQAAQEDPNSQLTGSSARIFYLWGSVTDDDNSQTETVLATYRSQLKARALSSSGPPPYAHCPV